MAVFVVGLLVTVWVSVSTVRSASGVSDVDCDDCGVAVALDDLGWVLASVGLYVGIWSAGWFAAQVLGRRRG